MRSPFRRSDGRLRQRTALIKLALLLVVLGASVGRHWWTHDHQRGMVAIPPAGSSASHVVRAYVEAENARDRSTIDALSDPAFTHRALDNVSGVRLLSIDRGIAAGGGITEVGVHLRVSGGDETFNGVRWWGYKLRRGGPAGWQIISEGTG